MTQQLNPSVIYRSCNMPQYANYYLIGNDKTIYNIRTQKFLTIDANGLCRVMDANGVYNRITIARLYNITFTDELLHKLRGVILDDFPEYIILKEGKVFSLLTNKYLTLLTVKRNRNNSDSKCDAVVYLQNKDKIQYATTLHRLLALAYIPNPDNKPEVNHIDGNPLNNNLDNLEWVTKQENTQHARDNKLYSLYKKCAQYKIEYSEEYVCTFPNSAEAVRSGYGTDVAHIRHVCEKNMNVSEGSIPYTSGGYVFRNSENTIVHTVHKAPEFTEWDITKLNSIELIEHPAYRLTDDGRLYNQIKKQWISSTVNTDKRSGNKYVVVGVHIEGRTYKKYRLAKLMATLWLGISNDNVYFKDNNPLNCKLNNLYYDKKGTTDISVDVYKLLSREVPVKEYESMLDAAISLGDENGNKDISEVVMKNASIPIRTEFSAYTKVYTYKGYSFRGI